jgi:hypothetical protein
MNADRGDYRQIALRKSPEYFGSYWQTAIIIRNGDALLLQSGEEDAVTASHDCCVVGVLCLKSRAPGKTLRSITFYLFCFPGIR